MIVQLTAYCPREKGFDLGWTYNELMKRLRPDDWAVFLDHDAMWTTPHWYRQLEEAVRRHPNAGAFTCMTNRIGCAWQRAKEADQHNHDILYHRKIGKARARRYGHRAHDVTDSPLMSGVMMMLSAKAHARGVRFQEGAFFGVDNSLHRAVKEQGLRLYLLPGVYTYHFYRGDGDASHLPLKGNEQLHFPEEMQP